MTTLQWLEALSDIDDCFLDEAIEYRPRAKGHKRMPPRRMAWIAVLLVLLCVVAVAAADAQDYFARWFLAPEPSSMNPAVVVTRLESNVIADTSDVTIEAMDVLRSGADTKVAFLVTLKREPSAMRDDVLPTMRGFQFTSIDVQSSDYGDSSADDSSSVKTTQYYYESDDIGLLPHQFLVVLNFQSSEAPLQIRFGGIGYVSAETGTFIVPYPEVFQFELESEGYVPTEWTYALNQRVELDGVSLILTEVKLTAFRVSMVLRIEELGGVMRFPDACVLHLQGGRQLTCKCTAGWEEECAWLFAEAFLTQPICPEEVTAIEFQTDESKPNILIPLT